MPDNPPLGPAANLQRGDVLAGQWTITEKLPQRRHATGGTFSVSYLAVNQRGRSGFLKAMDFHQGLSSSDPAAEIQRMTEAFNFERGVLEYCQENRLSRVVDLIDSGVHRPNPDSLADVIQFLVFEVAQGDIRAFIANERIWERAVALRTVHGVAAALQQLHRIRVAHQDVKPSNILLFRNNGTKLADFGRAFMANNASPHQDIHVAGDTTYAPPERLYRDPVDSWEERRAACDMYLLGNVIVFMVTRGMSLTGLLFTYMNETHHPNNWSGTYKEVLPYVMDAFHRILNDLSASLDREYVLELHDHLEQLCHPCVERRGHPVNIRQGANQYSFERYVSIFDRLARRAEISLKRHTPLQRQ